MAGPLAADNSTMETTRYGMVEKPNKMERDFGMTPKGSTGSIKSPRFWGCRSYWRPLVRRAASTTRSSFRPCCIKSGDTGLTCQDSSSTPLGIRLGQQLRGVVLDGHDGQHQAEDRREKPRQAQDGVAAKMFDDEYNPRGMIEGVFGAEETRRHRLR